MTTLDQAHEAFLALFHDFRANERHYLSSKYQESEARIDFIDKFWVALGWDVSHSQQRNPYEQEVKVERGVAVGLARQRADYAFFVAPNYRDGDVKFFVEAKRPGAELGTPDNCFQVIRYGWSSKSSVSILFNFRELLVIDCRAKPDIATATGQVLTSYSAESLQSIEIFAEVYWLFSREALANNSIDEYVGRLSEAEGDAGATLQRRKFQSIDEVFLNDLDRYREILARIFKLSNKSLDGFVLTELTQRTLDRLVFMRFLEDKLIEPERMVGKFGSGSRTAWEDFVAASRRLDGIYNGIVFKKSSVIDAPHFKVDEKQFVAICRELSDPNSPYDFNAIPIHILGSIYENFLGKVITVTGETVSVELKPEVRKAGGVYYTPEYIVRFITEGTVGKLIAGKNPTQISGMRFADIACGSGSFLLGIFDLLLRHHTQYYTENPSRSKKGEVAARHDGYHLSLTKKREILINNIFGVDIDAQAVEVAQLSLYLRLLEDETQGSVRGYQLEIGETLLPSLSRNIVCGNSVVSVDVLDNNLFEPGEEQKLNAMDWQQRFPWMAKSGGFDAVLGNPPYVDSEWMTSTAPRQRQYCASKYKAASGNWDLFCVFIEQSLLLLKEGGLSSLIVPNKLASVDYARKSREVLTTDNTLIALRDYSHVKVFPVSVYPIVYVVQKGPHKKKPVLLDTMAENGTEVIVDSQAMLPYKKYFSNPEQPWQMFANTASVDLIQKVRRKFPQLREASVAVVTGAATVAEAYKIGEIVKEGGIGFRLVNSGTIDRYILLWGVKPCRYLKEKYVEPRVPVTGLLMISSNRLRQAQAPKIIIAGMTRKLECALDVDGSYLAGKSTTVVIPKVDPYFLLGILNSRFVNFFYDSVFGGNKLAGGYLRVGPPQLADIPIPIPSSAKEVSGLVVLVKQIIELYAQAGSEQSDSRRDYLLNRCDAIEHKINIYVENLYGLTENEKLQMAFSMSSRSA